MTEPERKQARVRSIRQTEDQAALVELVARVDEIAVAELIRVAIADHIARRREDPEFQARLRERIEADQKILDRIAAS